jgi:hypothetical protein
LVAPGLHRRHPRGALGGVGAPQLSLASPVAVHDEIAARRTARGPAARAPRRTNRRHRRHRRLPRLDADRTSANPIAAPHLACSELDAKGSAKISLRVTFLSVADTASLRLLGRLLRHPGRARYPPFRGALVVTHPPGEIVIQGGAFKGACERRIVFHPGTIATSQAGVRDHRGAARERARQSYRRLVGGPPSRAASVGRTADAGESPVNHRSGDRPVRRPLAEG